MMRYKAWHVEILIMTTPTTTDIYTLSLHDALPICQRRRKGRDSLHGAKVSLEAERRGAGFGAVVALSFDHGRAEGSCEDRKSTRLNSSHSQISYAVFCLKKKTSRILVR